MIQITRWDTGAVIYEGDGAIGELVAACGKLGISALRADLTSADLTSANLTSADLRGADLPIWCRWAVSFQLEPALTVAIGSKQMAIAEWDAWFAGSEEFDTARGDEQFVRIRANYLAIRAYLVTLGHHTDPS